MSGRRQAQALSAAVDLLRMPSQVRSMRSAPLPPGILLLLRLAADDSDAREEAERITRRAQEVHRRAAIFFIEQILLIPRSDARRMLGVDESATSVEIRRHMVYLLKWLHPDRNADPHRARLARRVLLAWRELNATNRAQRCEKQADRKKDLHAFRLAHQHSIAVRVPRKGESGWQSKHLRRRGRLI